MNFWKINSRSFVFSFLAISSTLLLAVFLLIDNRRNNAGNQLVRLEKILTARMAFYNDISAQLAAISDSATVVAIKALADEGKIDGYRIYHSDSLLCWSDNQVSLPALFPNGLSGLFINKFGTTFLLGRVIHKNSSRIVVFDQMYNAYPSQNRYLFPGFTGRYASFSKLSLTEGDRSKKIDLGASHSLMVQYESAKSMILLNQWLLLVLVCVDFASIVLLLFSFSFRRSKRGLFRLCNNAQLVFMGLVIVWIGFYFFVSFISKNHSGLLFSPGLMAADNVNSNLALLTINTLGLLFFCLASYYNLLTRRQPLSRWRSAAFILLLAICFGAISSFASRLLLHSSIIPDTILFNSQGVYLLLQYCLIFTLYLAWLLVLYGLVSQINPISRSKFLQYLILFAAGLLVTLIIFGFVSVFLSFLVGVAGVLIFLVFLSTIHSTDKNLFLSFPWSLLIIAILSVQVSAMVLHVSSKKELVFRQNLGNKFLLSDRDLLLEAHIGSLVSKIQSDSVLQDLSNQYAQSSFLSDTLFSYIQRKYFSGYLLKYNAQLTACFPQDVLRLSGRGSLTGCRDFFADLKAKGRSIPDVNSLYYLSNVDEGESIYLLEIPLQFSSNLLSLYFEFFRTGVSRGIGLPEVVSSSSSGFKEQLSKYSYAYYDRDTLLSHAGEFSYWRFLSENNCLSVPFNTPYITEGWSHLKLSNGPDSCLVISLKDSGKFYLLTVFSYLFIGFGLLYMLFLLCIRVVSRYKLPLTGLQDKVQISVLVLIFVSMALIGVVSVYHIFSLNATKNRDLLTEKTHSILVELQHKLSAFSSFSQSDAPQLEGLLMKFSEVFFSDINLYDTSGTLLASSNPEIYQQGILANYMNPDAFDVMCKAKYSFFVHTESLGSANFQSSYLTLNNAKNQAIAYLNLPAFSKLDDLRAEVSSFLVTFINTFAIILVVASVFGLFVSRFITNPLKTLVKHLSSFSLGGVNSRIYWNSKDEIGLLIREYNSMVDKLDTGAVELKIKEREETWKEMARQVAHEVKNPLTPLKLNFQMLTRAWKDNDPDFGVRLDKFSFIMEEQIDKLIYLASNFGKMATLPEPQFADLDIRSFFNSLIEFYNGQLAEISVSFNNLNCSTITTDKSILDIVINNLILNGIQSVSNPENARIHISVYTPESSNDKLEIRVSDNGNGIPESEFPKIFTPYFTTKSSGSGIGLFLASQLMNKLGGDIWFESTLGQGTSFFLLLPSSSKS